MSALGEPLLLRAVRDPARIAQALHLLRRGGYGGSRWPAGHVDLWELYDPATTAGGPPRVVAATTPPTPADCVILGAVAFGDRRPTGDLERRLIDDVADALRVEGVAVLRAGAPPHSSRAATLRAAGFRPVAAAPSTAGAVGDAVWFDLEL